ncbi:Serine/threonine-protein kinase OSR1 (Oxidative stress-responsive 1 protein) [Durusdinium trenchii]|uniref:Serine/threonine-protein kinase OSR1 (Oxidative stress-responsive 1 protein) n=1 Tax=Durusdinium trenchii TaxID=1381693 RepID=A0ABP0JJQ3_9DINO
MLSRGKSGRNVEAEAAPADLDLDWPQNSGAYELKAQIGQGAFAKVWQARCDEKDTDVAIKIMELDNLMLSIDDIYQEVRVMLLSKNPSVLRAYACFVVKRSLWLVMPLMRKGSCLRIMRVMKRAGLGEGMKEDWIATILKATLIGLEYFHKQGKVHRDIKASNLLMDSDGSVMISDFGVAGWLPSGQQGRRDGEQRRTFVGTPCWMAPEVMEQTSPYDEKADIWSFGITALELAKSYAPYARLAPMKVLLNTIQMPPPSLKSYDDYQETKQKFSRHFRDIITLCLQKNPAHRPSAATLLTKRFFKNAPTKEKLVKELLETVPIPDTCDTAIASDSEKREQQMMLEKIQQDQQEHMQKQKLKEAGPAPDANSEAEPAATIQAPTSSSSSSTGSQTPVPAPAPESSVSPTAQGSGEAPPPAPDADQASAPDSAAAQTASSQAGATAPDSEAPPGKAINPRIVARLEAAPQGSSFVRGATWDFDDDEEDAKATAPADAPAASGAPAGADAAAATKGDGASASPNGVAGAQKAVPASAEEKPQTGSGDEVDGFEAFALEYSKMGVKGEDGKVAEQGS